MERRLKDLQAVVDAAKHAGMAVVKDDEGGYSFINPSAQRGKGRRGDATASQSIAEPQILGAKDCVRLYEGNFLCQTLANVYAEDLTREGWRFECAQVEDVAKHVNSRMQDLGLQGLFAEMAKDDAIFGSGFLAMGVGGVDAAPAKELILAKNAKLEYINHIPADGIKKWDVGQDPLVKTFNKPTMFYLAGETEKKVHATRMLAMVTRPRRKDRGGLSQFQYVWRFAQVLENCAWSTGLLLLALVMKIYKVKGWAQLDKTQQDGLLDLLLGTLDADITSSSTFVIDAEEELGLLGGTANLGPVRDLIDYVFDLTSMTTQVPKSHLVGNQQGQVSGAGFDSMRYFARIRGIQENYLKPLLARVADVLIWETGTDPAGLEYKITFNPLYVPTQKEQAEMEKLWAETDGLRIDQDVKTPDEIRMERYGKPAMAGPTEPEPEPGDGDQQ